MSINSDAPFFQNGVRDSSHYTIPRASGALDFQSKRGTVGDGL
jgi:hypothetical protein